MADTLESSQNVPFLRQLAMSDLKTRTSALDSLRLYLTNHSTFTATDLLKLWKGLYYCMWMSDRPRTQQLLANDFADLVDVLKPSNIIPFLDAFWKTMAREWTGIDKLRMDKYLYLVRRYLNVTFVKGLKNAGGEGLERFVGVLVETPLHPSELRVPNGLRYHVLDIFADELEKAAGEVSVGDEVLRVLIQPVVDIAEKSPTKSIRKRGRETLDDERMAKWRGVALAGEDEVDPEQEADQTGEDGGEWSGIDED